MACFRCSEDGNNLFKTSEVGMVYGKNVTYVCKSCGQRWWCYNDFHNLWSRIEDDITWDNVRSGCPLPVSIGNPSVTLQDFIPEKYARPINVCFEKVRYAKLSVVDGPGGEIVAAQWTGEYDEGNIFSHQFNFHILCNKFFGCKSLKEAAEYYQIAYLGRALDWPQKEHSGKVLSQRKGNNENYCIIHLMSHHFPQKYPSGMGPASFVAKMILIGDPNVGIIRPAFFYDPIVAEQEIYMFKEKHG